MRNVITSDWYRDTWGDRFHLMRDQKTKDRYDNNHTGYRLIGSFRALGKASPAQKAELLSKGISEAMNNTAFGLSIAVVCIIGHLLLTNRSKAMIEEIELDSMKLENMLARRVNGGPKP